MKHYTITIEDSFGARRKIMLSSGDKHTAVARVRLRKGEHSIMDSESEVRKEGEGEKN